MNGYHLMQTRFVMVPPTLHVFEARGNVHIHMEGGYTNDSDAPEEMRRREHCMIVLDENEAMGLVAWLNNAVERVQRSRRNKEARRQRAAELRKAKREAR